MKTLRTLAAALLCTLVSFGQLAAREYNDAELKARANIEKYLQDQGFSTRIDRTDGSINFKKNDVLYWITFDGSEKNILYTLHRKTIPLSDSKSQKNEILRRREIAEKAVNTLNLDETYKAALNGNKVEFEFPVYASSPEEYRNVFPRVFKAMANCKDAFDKAYKTARVKTDSIHSFWMNNDTSRIVVTQVNRGATTKGQSGSNLAITSISLRNVDANNQELSGYDQALRQSKCQFIQPQVTVKCSKKGTFKIGMKIFTPSGKLLVPSKDAVYTTVTTIEVKKTGAEVDYPLESFGSSKKDFWVPGQYKLLFFEDDRVIYEDSMNIL